MDLFLLVGIATACLVVIVTLLYFSKKQSAEKEKPAAAAGARAVPLPVQQGVPRRAQIARATRNRVRATADAEVHNEPPPLAPFDQSDDEGDDGRPVADFSEEKIGTKKRAKLEAKAEKKAQREIELKLREEQKVKDQQLELERKKLEEKERQDELRQAEEEQKAREEQERREHEEYLKMKAAFSVEEEGFDEQGDDEKENLLQEFVDHIKNNKVVVLEDLAAHFKLKTQAAIDRIVELQKENRLSGVIDDRGKFIYISEEELKAVAKFIRQRGRVSITELAESSNNLINLNPVTKVT